MMSCMLLVAEACSATSVLSCALVPHVRLKHADAHALACLAQIRQGDDRLLEASPHTTSREAATA